MSIQSLARPEIVSMKPYSSARKEGPASGVLLNANESPWPLLDSGPELVPLNRYPDPQPGELLASLAKLYSLDEDHVLVTRGSDEGIDLLVRVFCRAGIDAILHCPPTFGMYRVAAEIQGAEIVSVPRLPGSEFAMNTAEMLRKLQTDRRIKLVFLTSPNNPTGDCVTEEDLRKLLAVTENRALVVIDEAYAEFTGRPSGIALLESHPHLVVLRTLSKAWASAGLRCGSVLAQPAVIDLLRRVIAPYPLASPIAAMAVRVLQTDLQQRQQRQLAEILNNKQLLLALLARYEFILECWPGEANFVLIRIPDAQALLKHCGEHGVVLRSFPSEPLLRGCLRISVGSAGELAALEQAFDSWEAQQP